MPPKRRGRPSPAQKATPTNLPKEGISIGLVTDEEEDENELGGATLEFNPVVSHEGMKIPVYPQKYSFSKWKLLASALQISIVNILNLGPNDVMKDEVGGLQADMITDLNPSTKNPSSSIVLSPR